VLGRASEELGYAEFGVFISYEAQPEAHLPLLGTATFGFRLSPASTVTVATLTDPIPRFVNTSRSINFLTITR